MSDGVVCKKIEYCNPSAAVKSCDLHGVAPSETLSAMKTTIAGVNHVALNSL
jgi:hypothetical protein